MRRRRRRRRSGADRGERMGALWPGVLALVAALGSGCVAPEPPAQGGGAQGTETRRELFDGFESRPRWFVDSADDRAELSRSSLRATEGRSSLRIAFQQGPRKKVMLRRDCPLDLSLARSLSIDVWSASAGLSLAVAVVTEPGSRYFESQAVSIPQAKEPEPGWHTLRFRLDGPHFKSAETGWQFGAVLANANRVERLALLVYTDGVAQGEVFLDNLSFDRPASELVGTLPPTGLEVRAKSRFVKLWGLFELEVSFDASYRSAFDPRELELRADILAPSGLVASVPGFLSKDGVWRIRYMPIETGRHSFEVSVANSAGRMVSPGDGFQVSGESDRPPVRVSRRDARQFELASGAPFYPIGMNVAWASDFRPYFRKFAAAGGNLVRVWLAPWSLPVASRRKAGEVDLDAAERLEQVLALARDSGLRVQLVLAYHGEFDEGWRESPYAAANGGPCAVPGEFFSNAEARAAFRSFLRYVAARWASSPAVFAWELFNEVDLVPQIRRSDVLDWHREMARYLRLCDPTGRPVTTSTCGLGALRELSALREIDFLQAHIYRADMDSAVLDASAELAPFHKPGFVGEFGGDWRASSDQADESGVRLRAGLWLSLASDASGTAMPWWWDSQIDPHDLYRLWRPVAALAGKIERRGAGFRLVHQALGRPGSSAEVTRGVPETTRVHGIMSRTEGLLYIYDPRVLANPWRRPEVLPGGGTLVLEGLVDGPFEVELWSPLRDSPLSTAQATAEDGRLAVELPYSTGELAVRFRAASAREPGIAR